MGTTKDLAEALGLDVDEGKTHDPQCDAGLMREMLRLLMSMSQKAKKRSNQWLQSEPNGCALLDGHPFHFLTAAARAQIDGGRSCSKQQ